MQQAVTVSGKLTASEKSLLLLSAGVSLTCRNYTQNDADWHWVEDTTSTLLLNAGGTVFFQTWSHLFCPYLTISPKSPVKE